MKTKQEDWLNANGFAWIESLMHICYALYILLYPIKDAILWI